MDPERARDYEERRFASAALSKVNAWEKRFARDVFEHVGRDAHVLDVPCGNGRFYEVFAGARQLTMIDKDANMIAAARERWRILPHATLCRGRIESPPIEDGAADLVFCMRLFHHLKSDSRRRRALAELARVSSRFVALSFFNRNSGRFHGRSLLRFPLKKHFVAHGRLIALARRAGLEPVWRRPRINVVHPQCLVLFEKVK